MSEYLVEMNDITVQFPGVLALDHVRFNAKPGEVHVLLGENGAGKSTIMKVLAGVNTNYEGEIIYKGEKIVARSIEEQRERGVSIIFQGAESAEKPHGCGEHLHGPSADQGRRADRLEDHEPQGA